jgi:hypothetical protein
MRAASRDSARSWGAGGILDTNVYALNPITTVTRRIGCTIKA